MNSEEIHKLKNNLETKIIGHEILYYPELSSTNDEARQQAENDLSEGLVVIADKQTRGRGRRSRFWESPKGGLWFTIVLKPKIEIKKAPLLTLLTGLVIANIIKSHFNLEATLKWPNDVRINGKKVCGILSELNYENDRINFILIGIGLNVNNSIDQFPNELRETVTTLCIETGTVIDEIKLMKALLKEFENIYLKYCEDPTKSYSEIILNWRKLSDTVGRAVNIETVSGSISGKAINIAEDGALIIKKSNGEIERIIAGDCVYLKQ